MGKLLNYHIVFESETDGQPEGELYKQARKRLENKLMKSHTEGNVSFKPLALKRMDADGHEKEICDEYERDVYRQGSVQRGYMVTDKGGTRFPSKGQIKTTGLSESASEEFIDRVQKVATETEKRIQERAEAYPGIKIEYPRSELKKKGKQKKVKMVEK